MTTAGNEWDATEIGDADGTLVKVTLGGTEEGCPKEGGLKDDSPAIKARASVSVLSFL